MAEMPKIQDAMAQAVVELSQMPSYAWRGWILYMLGCLEEGSSPDEYRQALEALHADVRARLLAGYWQNVEVARQ